MAHRDPQGILLSNSSVATTVTVTFSTGRVRRAGKHIIKVPLFWYRAVFVHTHMHHYYPKLKRYFFFKLKKMLSPIWSNDIYFRVLQ